MVCAAAGCGRTAISDTSAVALTADEDSTDEVPDLDVTLQPNLFELLPEHASVAVGYWRMAGDWNDQSANANHLTTYSGVPSFSTSDYVVGNSSGAFYDDGLRVDNSPSLEVDYLSFSVWLKSDLVASANSNSGHTVFKISCASCGGQPDIDIAVTAKAHNNGELLFADTTAAAGTLVADTWFHIAGVYSALGTELYVNGTLVASSSTSQPPLQTSGGYLLVSQLWPNVAPLYNPQYLHGNMQELIIWRAALTASEIADIYVNQRN